MFGPLKWYTDRKFFGDGGGGGQKWFPPEKIFGTKGTNNLQVFNILSAVPPQKLRPSYGLVLTAKNSNQSSNSSVFNSTLVISPKLFRITQDTQNSINPTSVKHQLSSFTKVNPTIVAIFIKDGESSNDKNKELSFENKTVRETEEHNWTTTTTPM